ncbi:MAG: M23 family metallopeptidase, partial [Bacteroidales bacterium]|nr:M23 family metallopeptidase [Bacteroidales bacterium]
MAKKVFYCYNPETDNFERYYPSMRDRLMTLSRYLVAGAAIGTLFAVGFYYLTGGPTENALRHENSELRSKYNVLSRRLDNSLKVMDNIKNRDDNFYRVMMQMEPLARSRRYAGLDNSSRYADIASLSDAALVTRVTQQMDLLDRQLYAQSLSFDQLKGGALEQKDKLAHIPSVLPINIKDFTMSSGYGYRRDPVYGAQRFHEGLDFAAPTGTEVYATADGIVEIADRKGGYGNMIDITH